METTRCKIEKAIKSDLKKISKTEFVVLFSLISPDKVKFTNKQLADWANDTRHHIFFMGYDCNKIMPDDIYDIVNRLFDITIKRNKEEHGFSLGVHILSGYINEKGGNVFVSRYVVNALFEIAGTGCYIENAW